MDRKDLLRQIQSYCFAAYDMLLYLDTHPDEKKAFSLFRELVEKSKELKKEYQNKYGPLSAFATAQSQSFDWLDNPWPWEKEANK